MKLLIKTLHGLEDVLAEEIKELGGQNLRKMKRAVACEGDKRFLYRANYNLRTALRILVPIYTFKARDEKELYNQVRRFDWSDYMDVHQTFAIDNSVFSEFFRHSKYATLKMKDAMADLFRDKFRKRPSIDVENPDVQFDLHGWKDNFTVSLDSSGQPLNQRGYRDTGHAAPLNEVLAAGMVKLAQWDAKQPLVDPMCGTGTILIEAAMMGQQMPPQLLRKNFCFRNWKDFDPVIWNRIKLESDGNMRKRPLKIDGGDVDENAVKMARKSLRKLGLSDQVKVRHIPFEKHIPGTPDGMIITNPPYGERIEKDDILAFYKTISDLLKNNFQGFEAWVLSSNFKALNHIKLSPSQKIQLYNGSLECKFHKYELYAGSRAS